VENKRVDDMANGFDIQKQKISKFRLMEKLSSNPCGLLSE
jgi:hypothetical protein